MDRQIKIGIIINIVCFLAIVFAFIIKKLTVNVHNNIFEKTIINLPGLAKSTNEKNTGYSFWPLSHIILYIILGIVAPDYWYLWIIIGIFWEIIEFIFGKFSKTSGKNNTQYGDKWLNYRFSDIFFNLFGLLIGVSISKLI